jgi:hypothetical protein
MISVNARSQLADGVDVSEFAHARIDPAQVSVWEALNRLDGDGARAAKVLRATFDQLYDGGRSGRYRWDQLFKTEKTHFGTLVEINLQREFEFDDGTKLDFRIAGHEVDAKYSQDIWKWMLPPEAVDELCLVLTANDHTSTFSMGLVRASADKLGAGVNRDGKKTLSLAGRESVLWLQRDAPLPPNVLLQMQREDVDAVFAKRSGQQRVNELFRRAIGRRVSRTAVETVAQQRDPMKRVRGNGGARQHLAAEGIAIFGGDYAWQRIAARQLGLPEPAESEFVSAYLKVDVSFASAGVEINGGMFHLATRDTADAIPPSLYKAEDSKP